MIERTTTDTIVRIATYRATDNYGQPYRFNTSRARARYVYKYQPVRTCPFAAAKDRGAYPALQHGGEFKI